MALTADDRGLLASGRRLMALGRRETSADELERASEAFARDLAGEPNPRVIITLLDEDVEDDLPISAKTAAFERLLELGARTPDVLRRFADHLWFHGPESDELAAALNAEAEILEREIQKPEES